MVEDNITENSIRSHSFTLPLFLTVILLSNIMRQNMGHTFACHTSLPGDLSQNIRNFGKYCIFGFQCGVCINLSVSSSVFPQCHSHTDMPREGSTVA